MRNPRVVATVVGAVVAATVVLVVSGYVLLTRVLPGPWHAEHVSQLVADRVAPGQLRVTGATWDFELGGYALRARLADDPDAEVSWHTRSGSWCEPGSACGSAIPQAITAARAETAETRALLDAFGAGGCPVAGLSRLHSGGDRPAAQVVVTTPRVEVAAAGPRLEACVRSWARTRADQRLGAGAYAAVDLVDPGPPASVDADDPLVVRLDDAASGVGTPHSTTTVEVDPGGALVASPGSGLRPNLPLDELQDRIDPLVAATARDWLARRGIALPGVTPDGGLAADHQQMRYRAGRTDRVRMYVSPPRGSQAVAMTVDRDGGRPDEIALVDVVDGRPQDPLADAGR